MVLVAYTISFITDKLDLGYKPVLGFNKPERLLTIREIKNFAKRLDEFSRFTEWVVIFAFLAMYAYFVFISAR